MSEEQVPTTDQVDPLDKEAAEIDARDPDADEEIEELAEHAAELGRDVEPEMLDLEQSESDTER